MLNVVCKSSLMVLEITEYREIILKVNKCLLFSCLFYISLVYQTDVPCDLDICCLTRCYGKFHHQHACVDLTKCLVVTLNS